MAVGLDASCRRRSRLADIDRMTPYTDRAYLHARAGFAHTPRVGRDGAGIVARAYSFNRHRALAQTVMPANGS
jgi:hypothetical protein